MRKALSPSVLLLLLVMVGPVAAAEATFVSPDRFDLTKLLAPAPAPDSGQQRRDLAQVLAVQKNRTAEQAERALTAPPPAPSALPKSFARISMRSACR